jgi:hypothetical protein
MNLQWLRLLALALALPSLAFAAPSEPAGRTYFANLYAEGNYLGDSNNIVGFSQLRGGRLFDRFELYADARLSTDTRSDFRPLGQVFNDNFVFLGVGADYLPAPLPWLRLRLQVGHDFNLGEDALRPEGFDLLGGWLTYNEFEPGGRFLFENYSEGLYYYRYRNAIFHDQLRLLWRYFETRSSGTLWGAAPITMAVINFDTSGVQYNRFFDSRTGIRFYARTHKTLFSLTPMYVVGTQLQGSRSYGEFRLLGVVYVEL